MLLSHSIEMYGYEKSNGKQSIIVKDAPEHIKQEARELNKMIEEKFGEKEHYIIEDDCKRVVV
ncbi:MAG: hypothetical protein J6Y71_07620 [Ruminococcus sp.]|nr:hypothetical protein [Ruminococcus sp.]